MVMVSVLCMNDTVVLPKVPHLPTECQDWDEADLLPVKEFLEQAVIEGTFRPDPTIPWDIKPIM